MKRQGVKYQITIPTELSAFIEKELKDSYLTKTAFFVKLVKNYMDSKSVEKGPRRVTLNI